MRNSLVNAVVNRIAATNPAPSKLAYGYPHMRNANGLPAWARRKYRWVTNIIIQANSPPNIEIANISVNDVLGNSTLSRVASAMPIDDSRSAATGVPRLLNLPNRRGAYPARASENIIRAVIYNWLFMAESAATRITKFTTPAAKGTCDRAITVTNGLCPFPDSIQGTMPRMIAIERR